MKPKEPSQKKETHSRKRRKKLKVNSPVTNMAEIVHKVVG